MTTDTALLVSKEILEDQRPIDSLKFTDDPQIPMDNTLVRFLDELMPLATLDQPRDFNENKPLADLKAARLIL